MSGHLTVIYTVTTPECPAKGAVATAFGEAATDLKTRLNAAGFTVTTEEAKLVDGVWDPSDASETYRDLVKKAHQTLPACAAVRVPRF